MPLSSRTFSQLIDFTRTSAATFVNSSGNIASTPQSRNLLTFTNEFANAAWTKTNATIIPNVNPAAASLGSELVTNGDFASGTTGWTDITGSWAVTGGALAGTSISASAFGPYSNGVATANRIYLATFTITVTSGSVLVRVGNTESSAYSTGGTYSQYFVATSSAAAIFQVRAGGSGFTGTIDNVSVREVIGGALQAPDGTFTADTLLAAAGTGFIPRVADTSNPTTINAAAYTASMYVKAGTYTFFQIYINNQSSEWVNFTLTGAGTASANGSCTATITALSGGWYRCTMSYTAGGTDRRPLFMMAASGSATRAQTWNPAGTETIFIWGAQLEQASAATDYTRNFGGLFPPRFDYDPVTRAPRGLLIEERRTNLLVRSEEFDNVAWTKLRSSVTANATTSPDGTVDADKLVEDTTASDTHFMLQIPSASPSTAYTFSVYLKAAERTRASLQDGGGSQAIAYFDLSNGTVISVSDATASITNAGNGWYRCSITLTTGGAQTNVNARIFLVNTGTTTSYTGDGTSGIFIYGAQLEAGAFATSYIPTVASQVTRTADVAAINAPNFASWYNQSAGSFVVEAVSFKPTSLVAATNAITASDGTANNAHAMRFVTANVDATCTNGGVLQFDATGVAYTAGAVTKMAYAYTVNDFAFVVNNGAAETDLSGTIPTVDRLGIGVGATNLNQLSGHIRSIRYYPTKLSNAQLQALTA